MADVDVEREAPFSFGVTVAFTLNYIIGTGFLTLPWGFTQTGNILGIGVLGLMTMFAISAALLMLEAMARAEAYANQTNNFGSFRGDAVYKTLLPITLRNDSQGFLSLKESRTENSAMLPETTTEPIAVELLAVGNQKYEITELCKIFMGKQSVRIYTVLISLYMYGTLWAYSTVFADSLAMRLPLFAEQGDAITPGSTSYMIYLLVFASIVVPSSMIELSEQVFVQVTLSFCRVLMLILMVSTIALAMLQQQADIADGHGNSSMPFGPLTRILSDPSSNNITHDPMNAKKLYLLLPMAAYATIFHHSIPSISQPVRNKLQLGRIFTVTLLLCFIAYSVMSIVISNYFGDKTLISSNLDWEFYWGKLNVNREIPLYARCISSFVVLLPALDVASAFPLNAITLGNSLMSSYYGSRIHVLGVVEASRAKIVFRAVASVPPILAASMVSNLGTITHFAGVSGFAIAFIFPSLLAIYSERLLVNHGLPHKTQYSCWLTSRWICLLSIAIGLFLIIFVVTSLCVIGPPPS
jgi:hypothetical protein